MKNKILSAPLVTAALLLSTFAGAQVQLPVSPTYNFAQKHAGPMNSHVEEGRAIARSSDGTGWMTYVAGNFTGQITLGTTTHNSVGLKDIYVARLDAAGNVVASQTYGTAADDEVFDMACDVGINVAGASAYLVGRSGGNMLALKYPITLSGGPLISPIGITAGAIKGVVRDGSTLMITGILATGGQLNYGNGQTLFGSATGCNSLQQPAPDPDLSNLYGSMFIARLNSSMQPTVAVQPFSAGSCSVGNDIAYMSTVGRFVVTGGFSGALQFNNNSASQITAQGTRDIFICSVSAACTFDLNDQKGVGTSTSEIGNGGAMREMGLSVASNGSNVYVSGRCNSGTSFGGSHTVTNTGPFIARYSVQNSGITGVNWVSGLLSGSSVQDQSAGFYGLSAATGRVWVTGAMRGGTLKSIVGPNRTIPTNRHTGLIACYSDAGQILWADAINRTGGNTSPVNEIPFGRAIVEQFCNVAYTGSLIGANSFGNQPLTVSGTGQNAFVAQIKGQFAMPMNIVQSTPVGGSLPPYQPTVHAVGATGWNWTVTPSGATIVGANTATPAITFNAPGNYTITCTTTGGSCPGSGITRFTWIQTPGMAGPDNDNNDTGILTADQAVQSYPNPTSGVIYFGGLPENEKGYQLTVFDAQGRRVGDQRMVGAMTDLSTFGLTPGVYMLQLQSEERLILTTRILLQAE